CASDRWACVVLAGWHTRERASPMLTAMANSWRASQKAAADSSPPTRSIENTPAVPRGKSRSASAASGRPGILGWSTRRMPGASCRRAARAAACALMRCMRRSRVSIPISTWWALGAGGQGGGLLAAALQAQVQGLGTDQHLRGAGSGQGGAEVGDVFGAGVGQQAGAAPFVLSGESDPEAAIWFGQARPALGTSPRIE